MAVWFAASREDAAAAGFDDALVYAEVAAPPDARRIPFRRALDRIATFIPTRQETNARDIRAYGGLYGVITGEDAP